VQLYIKDFRFNGWYFWPRARLFLLIYHPLERLELWLRGIKPFQLPDDEYQKLLAEYEREQERKQ
jgi:hypothetical protein